MCQLLALGRGFWRVSHVAEVCERSRPSGYGKFAFYRLSNFKKATFEVEAPYLGLTCSAMLMSSKRDKEHKATRIKIDVLSCEYVMR